MDKQTKQLIFLGALVVVGGIVAFFVLSGDGDAPPPADTTNKVANGNTTPPAAPQPAGAQPGADAKAGPVVVVVEDKEIPPDTRPRNVEVSWRHDPPPANPPVDYVKPYDPLFVQNIDVVEPERRKYIKALKDQWQLKGITETWHLVDVKDEEGNIVSTERKLIKEAWFKGKRRPYKVKDRLTNTRFQIEEIYYNGDEGKSGVVLLGDTGARVPMDLAPADRYGE